MTMVKFIDQAFTARHLTITIHHTRIFHVVKICHNLLKINEQQAMDTNQV